MKLRNEAGGADGRMHSAWLQKEAARKGKTRTRQQPLHLGGYNEAVMRRGLLVGRGQGSRSLRCNAVNLIMSERNQTVGEIYP